MTHPLPPAPNDPLDKVDRMLALLDAGFPAVQTLPYTEVRQMIRDRAAPVTNLDDVAVAEDVTPDGLRPLRIYRPHDPAADAPVILYFHGGGWVFCSIDSHDGFCRRLSRRTGALVVSVDYPLSPEHPYPAALEAGFAALEWLAAEARRLGTDPSRIFVMGDSAGGNLAAALCLMARDRDGPAIAGQILLYPALDADFTTEGYRRYGTGHYNTTEAMRYYWRQYLGRDTLPEPPGYAAPLRAASLEGLPPAVIVVPGRDPMGSENVAFAAALRRAGVPLRMRRYPDMFHGFLTMLAFQPSEGPRELLWADMRALFHKTKGKGHA